MSLGPTLASLYEAAAGSPPPPDVLARLVAEYDDSMALCEVVDSSAVTASFAELVTALVGRHPASGPVDGLVISALTEFFPCLPRLMPCNYLDYGEWACLTIPATGWFLHIAREGDLYTIGPMVPGLSYT